MNPWRALLTVTYWLYSTQSRTLPTVHVEPTGQLTPPLDDAVGSVVEEEEAGAGGAGEDVGEEKEAKQELWSRLTGQDSAQVTDKW